MKTRPALGSAILVGALAAAIAARLLSSRDLDGALQLGWPGAELGQYRTGAVVSAAVAGALLGISGAFLQGLLRNPLASPFVLGVSSGAGLGVAVAAALAVAAGGALTHTGSLLPAALGAIAALAAVLVLGRRRGTADPTTIVLAGVIIGAICAAGTMIAESALPMARRGELTTWMMGRIPEAPMISPGSGVVITACVALCVAIVAGLALGNALDASALSDDEARTVGVRVGAVRIAVLTVAGFATAASVVLCGPIAFVGLIAPHIARGLVGPGHRTMCIASAVAGAALLVGADAARQFVSLGGGQLPVGALTALIGGAAFLWLLRRTAGGWQS